MGRSIQPKILLPMIDKYAKKKIRSDVLPIIGEIREKLAVLETHLV